MEFENLKANGFDLTEGVKSHGWEWFFDRLKGLVYPELVKEFGFLLQLQIFKLPLSCLGTRPPFLRSL